jgi:hypothetical protein
MQIETIAPHMGGWTPTRGGFAYAEDHVRSSTVQAATLRRPLDMPADATRIETMYPTIARNGTAIGKVRIMRSCPGFAAEQVATFDMPDTLGKIREYEGTVAHAIDRTWSYWVEVSIDPHDFDPASLRVYDLRIGYGSDAPATP